MPKNRSEDAPLLERDDQPWNTGLVQACTARRRAAVTALSRSARAGGAPTVGGEAAASGTRRRYRQEACAGHSWGHTRCPSGALMPPVLAQPCGIHGHRVAVAPFVRASSCGAPRPGTGGGSACRRGRWQLSAKVSGARTPSVCVRIPVANPKQFGVSCPVRAERPHGRTGSAARRRGWLQATRPRLTPLPSMSSSSRSAGTRSPTTQSPAPASPQSAPRRRARP